MGLRVLLTPEAFMRPTGGVRRYAVELEKAIAQVGSSTRIGEGVGLALGRLAGRRVGGSLARLAVDAQAARLAKSADIVHSVYYDCSMLGRQMPLIASFQDCIHERFALTRGFRSSALARDKRRSVERARFVISISEASAHDAANYYGLDPQRSVIVPPPLADVFTVGEADDEMPGQAVPYFVFVGPRSGYKNWSLLVRAIGEIPRTFVSSALLSVGGGPLAANEHELLAAAGLDSRHTWLPNASDRVLASHYRSCVATVCPSVYEGFGYPVAEALCAGGRGVASDGGSLKEFQPFGCEIFPSGDAGELRDLLMKVIGDAATEKKSFSLERQNKARKAFGRPSFVEALSKIYREAL